MSVTMTNEEIEAWAKDPRRADTLPFGLYEPRHRKAITGAALVVRGVLYFNGGYTADVRDALIKCFEQYDAAMRTYYQLLEEAAGQKPSKKGPLRWFYAEGMQPMPYDQAPGFARLAKSVSVDKAFTCAMTSAEDKEATGFFEYTVFCQSDWKAALRIGLDVLDFTVPRAFLVQQPGIFEAMFNAFAEALPTVHGHAGLAVNLPPMGREPNEAGEYFYSRRFGPGIDVGNPARLNIRALENQIKTVDWLTALSGPLVQAVGGATSLALPPDWFVRQPLGADGLVIQAGVAPESGVSAGPGLPPNAPAAYVVLNAALRPIVAQTLDTLQSGTINSTAPLLNSAVASDHWLQRFNVPDDRLNDYWLEVHKTAKVTDVKAVIAQNLHRLRKTMGLPDPAPSNNLGYDGAPGA